jgi:hypothetical protein
MLLMCPRRLGLSGVQYEHDGKRITRGLGSGREDLYITF